MKMSTDAKTIRPHQATQPDWAMVKEWAKKKITKERMAEIGIVAGTLAAMGFLGSLLFKGIQTYSISGF